MLLLIVNIKGCKYIGENDGFMAIFLHLRAHTHTHTHLGCKSRKLEHADVLIKDRGGVANKVVLEQMRQLGSLL